MFLVSVLGVADVANAHRGIADGGYYEVVELVRVRKAAQRAQHQFPIPLIHAAAGNIGVLPRQCIADLQDGNLVGGEAIGIHPDVDGALLPAINDHLPHAAHRLDGILHAAVGNFIQFARGLVAGEDQGQNRRSIGVQFLDQRRLRITRQKADDACNGIAHILRGDVDIPVQVEGDGNDGQRLGGRGTDFVNAFYRGNPVFNSFGDGAFNLFRRSPQQCGSHADDGQVHVGKTIHSKTRVGDRTDHHHGHDQHDGEHGTADADLGELLHVY